MEYLSEVKASEAVQVMKQCKEEKSVHRFHRNGFSNDVEKTMRKIASFPVWFIFDPEYKKYFSPQMDVHERRKGLREILRKFPQFLCVDKV